VSGAKNAVLPCMAAAVLNPGRLVLRGVPLISDVTVMKSILSGLGVHVELAHDGEGAKLEIDASTLSSSEVHERLMRQMRSSVFLMGPLLARTGEVRISYPGGCAIGPRPINMHLKGLRAMGVEIRERYGFVHGYTGGLRGADINLDYPSVGATENIMMAAVLAEGTTVIRNAAREPEVVALADLLSSMGGKVKGAGSDVIRIEGVSGLSPATHDIIPDRIEAGTFMAAAAITGGEVLIEGACPDHMGAAIAKIRECGARVTLGDRWIRVQGPERLQPVDIKTLPYPGFPTDLQNQLMALLCVAHGTSIVTETVFENRFKVAQEFQRMGADIQIEGRSAIIKGVAGMSGAHVQAFDDLRGGAALVIAGLRADGVTTVEGVHHLDRGYEDFVQKLAGLGALVRRMAG